MRLSGSLILLAAAGCLAQGCVEPPPSFRIVSLEEAQRLVREGGVTLVDALEEGERAPGLLPGGIRWRVGPEAEVPPPVPPGPVLVVASGVRIGYRSGAALARAGGRSVYVVIADSAEKRGRLYALEPETEENAGGRDS